MVTTLVALALLSVAAEPIATAETPQTLLYVRTTPAGAEVRLDGKPLGTSDGLFPVKPGQWKLVVNLEGHEPAEQQITIRDGRITRIELTLKSAGGQPTQPISTESSTRFGPVVEQVLTSPKKGVAELLDLDTGRRAVTKDFGADDRQTHRWVREQKMDALGVVEHGLPGLLLFDTAIYDHPDIHWETITPREVAQHRWLNQNEPRPINTLATPDLNKLPLTCLFETREGSKGVLQLLGATEDGAGVRIRYKMLKPAGAEPTPDRESPGAAVDRRTIDKLLRDFPDEVDLSTPETAWAAWQRANARKDNEATSRLSWTPLNPAEENKWWADRERRDPEGTAIYLKALADSKILEVQTYRDDLADVITYLPFPPGKGRNPYSSRTFGKIDNQWKNLGEDRLPSLQEARSEFDRKKDALWRHFEALRKEHASSTQQR